MQEKVSVVCVQVRWKLQPSGSLTVTGQSLVSAPKTVPNGLDFPAKPFQPCTLKSYLYSE